MRYPNNLRRLRRAAEITQMDLAVRAKLADHRYWLLENGYKLASDSEQKRLARALKQPVRDVFPSSEAVAS